MEWEGTKEEGKKWAKAKTYFGALYKSRRSYKSDMKAHWSSFETANSFNKNPHNGSERSTTEHSADTADTKATKKLPTNQWVENRDSLEDSLPEAKEYAAAISSKSEADQTSIMAVLKEQIKQTRLAMDQNTKLMTILVKSGLGGEAPDPTHTTAGRKIKRSVCAKTFW